MVSHSVVSGKFQSFVELNAALSLEIFLRTNKYKWNAIRAMIICLTEKFVYIIKRLSIGQVKDENYSV